MARCLVNSDWNWPPVLNYWHDQRSPWTSKPHPWDDQDVPGTRERLEAHRWATNGSEAVSPQRSSPLTMSPRALASTARPLNAGSLPTGFRIGVTVKLSPRC